MDLAGWEERYRADADSRTALESAPTPLLVEGASHLPPGRALDLACGAGRNALWLARRGWSVTAVDGSPAAIENLRRRAAHLSVKVDARVAEIGRASCRERV